jgi:hypothetical protein
LRKEDRYTTADDGVAFMHLPMEKPLAMARVEKGPAGYRLLAENAAERELLAHGRRLRGEVILLEATYPVLGDRLLLPQTLSAQGAQRVRRALEAAALSHQEAEAQRRRFRLVPSKKAAPR